MKLIDKLVAEVHAGKLSRRDFLQKAGVLGLASAAPAALFSSSSALAATPKRGGHLSVATANGSTTDQLDPIQLSSGMVSFMQYAMHQCLTEVKSNGQLGPLLAESWEVGKDPSEWIFKLHKGVQFHNGQEVTSDDVIASLSRHSVEGSVSSMKSTMDTVVSYSKDGPHTVIIKLNTPNVDFPVSLSASTLSILPSKSGEVVQFDIGCGPYMLVSREAGRYAKLKRHPNYHLNDRAFIDTAEILTIADTTARQNALVTGTVDIIGDVSAPTAHLLDINPKVTTLDTVSTQHYTFPMRTDLAEFQDNNVRMALKLSIDREDILKKILRGHGVVGNDHPISPANRYFDSSIEQRVYDPEKAKWHLKQAGLSTLKLKLSASDGLYPGAVDSTILYAEHAKKAGIEIIPNRVPNDGYWSDVWLKHPWAASYWSGRPTEDWMFTSGYAAKSSWNESYWQNDRFNELLVKARGELDEAKRGAMYGEMQRLCRDDGGTVTPLFANHIVAHTDKVGVPDQVAGNWEFDGYKMLERWWVKS